MAENSKASLPRKSAFSCEACRKRKVKCNGASPSCARCAARGEVCVYSLAPTLSYTKTLEAKIAQLEGTITTLQGGGARESEKIARASPHGSAGDYISSPGQTPEQDENGDMPELSGDFEGLTVEDDGRISFHGATSLFNLPSGGVSESASPSQVANELEARKERLINNAWRERAFEQLNNVPEPYQYLLDFHWCWIQPLFNFVYRPAFTRDMKMTGPYYSDILLYAILSHSVRWCKKEPKLGPLLDAFDGGTKFYHSAVSGVFETLRVGYPNIPTVQTLLLLSAQECGRGNRTQAWLYSGMAFRLVEDLGISIDSRKYSRSVALTDEDIEIRNRLFWSCYFWDKLISLYFGRSPSIQNSKVSPPRMILDDTSEIEVWYPHGVSFPDGTQYPPTQAHSTSCFMRMCSLSEILNQVIIHIYDPLRQTGEHEFRNCVFDQEKNLSRWWDELPDYLKLVANNLPSLCPPSHIVTLNCLYHTVNILLHRPILCGRTLGPNGERPGMIHLVQCMNSATTILAMFDLYRRTFGDTHVVLSLAYSVYTAASIFLLEIKALKYAAPATLEKVKFCVVALERVKGANPVITTGLGLVYQELQKLQVDMQIPIPHFEPRSPTQTSRQSRSPQHAQASSRYVSPTQSTAASTPGSMNAGVAGTSTSPTLAADHFQQPMAAFEAFQQAAFHTDVAGAQHSHGPIPDRIMMNQDGTQGMTYEITPELYQAFSYVEPITTNMANTGFDAGPWGMASGATGPIP